MSMTLPTRELVTLTPNHLHGDIRGLTEVYRSYGDENPLHYFDTAGDTPLDDVVNTSDVRLLPGAVVVVDLYAERVRRSSPLDTNAYAFSFLTPTLFSRDYGLITSQIEGKTPGQVEIMPAERPKGMSASFREDLYSTIGQLWQERGLEALEAKKVPVVTALSINGDLPGMLIPKEGEVVPYAQGQIAIATVPLPIFARGLRSFLRYKP